MMMPMHVCPTTAEVTVVWERALHQFWEIVVHGNPLVEASFCFVHLHLSLLTSAMCAQTDWPEMNSSSDVLQP